MSRREPKCAQTASARHNSGQPDKRLGLGISDVENVNFREIPLEGFPPQSMNGPESRQIAGMRK